MAAGCVPFQRPDVLIVTAADGEDDAVRQVVDGIVEPWHEMQGPEGFPSTVWTATFESASGSPLRVALTRTADMGANRAAATVASFAALCKPQCLAMCGVCAGRPDWTSLGDVIIADRVYRYDTGETERRAADGESIFRADIMTYPMHGPWVDRARAFADAEPPAWVAERPRQGGVDAPWKIHVGPIATGSALVRDVTIWDRIGKHQRLVRGLDMEASSIGLAADFHDVCRMIVVKGVMDFGEPGRTQGFREFAARAAARVLIAFLRENLDSQSRGLNDVLASNVRDAPENLANPGTLLNARYAVVRFMDKAREQELAELETWCKESRVVGIRLFTGSAGSGKTRLFIEWTRRLRLRGWAAGFMRPTLNGDELTIISAARQPAFVVIDYAECHAEIRPFLATLMEMSAQRSEPLRVALVAREATESWTNLCDLLPALRDALAHRWPTQLRPVPVDSGMRNDLFMASAAEFNSRLGTSCEVPERDLSDERFGRILWIQMAALAAVCGGDVRADELLAETVAHEKRYWHARYMAHYEGDSLEELEFIRAASRVVAALTLRGETPVENATSVSHAVDGPADVTFVDFLHELYAVRESGESIGVLRGLEPDLLGEALVTEVLRSPWVPEYLERALAGATRGQLAHAFIVLGRVELRHDPMAQEWAEVFLKADVDARALAALDAIRALGKETSGATLATTLIEALDREGTLELAKRIYEDSTTHGEGGATLAGIMAWAGRKVLRSKRRWFLRRQERIRLGKIANNLSVDLSNTGSWQEALEVSKLAIKQFRKLAKTDAETFLPELAGSLSNHGNMYAFADLHEASLAPAREAVAIYRRLSEGDFDRFAPGLAMSLNNLSVKLNGVGRLGGALV